VCEPNVNLIQLLRASKRRIARSRGRPPGNGVKGKAPWSRNIFSKLACFSILGNAKNHWYLCCLAKM